MSTPVVRTRMAPSPTGDYHIGHMRTLLYNYALARQSNGQFIIRIEDTDQKRFIEGAEDRILQVIKDYGLSWDEGPDIGGPYEPYVQSKRLNIYQKYIKQLLDKNLAYYCFCTEDRLSEMRTVQKAAHQIPKYDRQCQKLTPEEVKTNLDKGIPFVVRLKVPDNEIITFTDAVRGEIKINTSEVDDQVLIKSDGIPTYHFAVVIDDYLMKITHILRGDEWISSTPKQILLYRYFGWELPQFAHLPVLLDPSGVGKMSKRRGSVSARSFLEAGYLPEALLNFLMLLGWNPGTDKEIYSLNDFVKDFSISRLHKKQPVFDLTKLDYLNGLYIRQRSIEELTPYFKKFLPQASPEQIEVLVPVLKDRLVKFADLTDSVKFLFEDVGYDRELLLKKGTDPKLAVEMLEESKKVVEKFEDLQNKFMELIKNNNWNTGDFFMVFRVAICGSAFTPPVVECLPALGRDNTLRKLDIAIQKLTT
jgi:glutamyl-tRNA synthetase